MKKSVLFPDTREVCGVMFAEFSSSSSDKVDEYKLSYRCDVCGVKFEDSSSFQVHRNAHCQNNFSVTDTKHVHDVNFFHCFSSPGKVVEHKLSYRCDVCPVKFEEYSSLEIHRRTHDAEKLKVTDTRKVCGVNFVGNCSSSPDMVEELNCSYRCDICGVKFEEYSSLEVHRNIHHEEKLSDFDARNVNFAEIFTSSSGKVAEDKLSYLCDVCGLKFEVYSSLKEHGSARNENNLSVTDLHVCDVNFAHIFSYSSDKVVERELSCRCDVCGVKFEEYSSLEVHERTHDEEQLSVASTSRMCDVKFTENCLSSPDKVEKQRISYRCNVCGVEFEEHISLIVHEDTHAANVHSYQQTRTGEKPFKCDVCGKSFTQSGSLKSHKRIHIGEKQFKCDVCGMRFRYSGNLGAHKRMHSGERPFKCDVCGKWFKHTNNLVVHKRIHTGEKPFKCDVCGKQFRRTGTLQSHKRMHSDERPFKCDVCGKWFKHTNNLVVHKRIHTGERPFKHESGVCGKTYTQSSNLESHKGTHTGEKPFKCDICGKKLARGSYLEAHKRIHTGEKPFQCDLCGKRFTHRSVLDAHKQTHTGKRPFECDVCGGRFTRKSKLLSHKRVHTGEKPFKCDVCGKAYNRNDTLLSHKRNHALFGR